MRVSASACATRSSTTASKRRCRRRNGGQRSSHRSGARDRCRASRRSTQARVIGVQARLPEEVIRPMLGEDLRHLLADRQARVESLARGPGRSSRCDRLGSIASAVRRWSADRPSPARCRRTPQPAPSHDGHRELSRPMPSHVLHPTPRHAAHVDFGRNSASPPAITPGGRGINRSSERAVTLLPEPVSPTRPSVSPSAMSKLTPSTADAAPRFVVEMDTEVVGPTAVEVRSLGGSASSRAEVPPRRPSSPFRLAGRARRGTRRRPG